jgi:hypothetical protein
MVLFLSVLSRLAIVPLLQTLVFGVGRLGLAAAPVRLNPPLGKTV